MHNLIYYSSLSPGHSQLNSGTVVHACTYTCMGMRQELEPLVYIIAMSPFPVLLLLINYYYFSGVYIYYVIHACIYI